jgi:hypothetical protein
VAALLGACGGSDGGSDPIGGAPAPSPAPAPAPSPAPADACGTQRTLALTDLAVFDGTYAVKVFDGSAFPPAELGDASLVLAAGALQFTPAAGLTGSVAASATVTAVCENTDSSGHVIGVVAVIDAQRHIDFFAPAFSGLHVSGTDLGSAADSGRYLQGTLPVDTTTPATPAGWGSASITSTALVAERSLVPNLLPEVEYENTSSGLAIRATWRRSSDPLRGDAPIDSVSVRYVAATGEVISGSVALVRDPANTAGGGAYAATCGPCTGITVDPVAGTVGLAATSFTATLLSSSPAAAQVTGQFNVPDYAPRSGSTMTAAAASTCQVTTQVATATMADLACLAGTHVGTGVDGGACTVEVDLAGQRISFDDGTVQRSYTLTASGGFTNLTTFFQSFSRSSAVTMSNPADPLETIALTLAPDPVVPEVTKLDMTAMKAIGGTLSAEILRSCRILFDGR